MGVTFIFKLFLIFLFLFWFLWNIYKQEIQLLTGILSKLYAYLKTSTEKQKHCYRISVTCQKEG